MASSRRAIAVAVFALALCGAATGACLQVAGLGDYEEGDGGGASTDASVMPASDGGVVSGGDAGTDAAPRTDGSTAQPCLHDVDCLSGMVCDTSQGSCVEATHCAVPEAGCAAFPQCGCSGATTCVPLRGTGPSGCSVAGTVPAGGACGGGAACQVGLGCYDSLCLAFCNPDDEGTSKGCGVGEVCFSVASAGSPPSAVCVPTCSPLSDGCDGGNCDFLPDLYGIPICVADTGEAHVGDHCDNEVGSQPSTHCASSLFCASTSICEYPVQTPPPACDAGLFFHQAYDLPFGYCDDIAN